MQPIPTGEPCQQVLGWVVMQHKDIISTVLEQKYLFFSVLDLSSSSETEKFLQKRVGA